MNKPKNSILAGVGIGSILLLSVTPVRTKAISMAKRLKDKLSSSDSGGGTPPIEKAGHSNPHDLEDNKMLAEGATYSVKYYNKKEQA